MHKSFWMNDLVRCPQHSVTHRVHVLPNATVETTSVQYSDAFPNATLTMLLGILLLECLGFVCFIIVKMQGLKLLETRSSFMGDTRTKTRRASVRSLDNRWWIAFFSTTAVRSLIELVMIQINVGTSAMHALVAVHRMVAGAQLLILTLTLNHQRVHRTLDSKKGRVSETLKRQVGLMNKIAFAIFTIFTAIDCVTSEVSIRSETTDTALYWVFIGVTVILTIPMWMCASWIGFHRAEDEPTPTAKRVLFAGVVVYFLLVFPPSFWNRYVFKSANESSPCPLGVFSIYDIFRLVDIFCKVLFFVFVKMEYRRKQLCEINEQYVSLAENLDADRLIQDTATIITEGSQSMATVSMKSGGSSRPPASARSLDTAIN